MRGSFRAYFLAIAALVAAVGVRWLLDPLMGDSLPLVTIFAAVAGAVWVGGWGPALLVTALGYVACALLFIAPRGELGLDRSVNVVGLIAYLFTCALIIAIGEVARRAQARAAERTTLTRLLASIVESSDDAIVRKTLDGTIQSWNAGAERLFGYSAAEAVGRHISLIIPKERVDEEDRIIATLRAGRRVDHFETVRLHKSGRPIIVSLTISPIRDDAGNVVAASKIARDVTVQRRAEAERQKFVTLAENSTDFIGICDLEGVPTYINPAGLAMVGLDSDEARRLHVRDFFLPEDQPRITGELLPAVLEKGHGEVEVRFRNFKTGGTRWMVYKVLTLSDANGRPEAFATVSQDVTERRQMEDDLRKLAADLSAADRQKNQFLATLAHELRNPLAPMRNLLEVLKRSGGNGALRPTLDTMDRQVGHLVRLVDDLLDLSRITHDRLELRRVRVELGALIQQTVDAARPLAEAAGHQVRIAGAAEPIYLHADPVRLAQVFGNLLNNSYKYTPPGGTVTVRTERRGDEAVVTVEDNGTGIPPEKLETIFEMFNQVDRELERSRGGLGIGLTLVRRLVQMHGGTVEARSGGEGQGSAFVVCLPLARAAASVGAPVAESAAATPPRPRRILVVDDNHDAAASLAMLLDLDGHDTLTANDGAAALATIREQRPDFVLLDIGLPLLNGYEVSRRVRAEPWGKEVTLIALTGWGQEEDRERSRAAGFDGHLVKPVDFAALRELLRSLPAKS